MGLVGQAEPPLQLDHIKFVPPHLIHDILFKVLVSVPGVMPLFDGLAMVWHLVVVDKIHVLISLGIEQLVGSDWIDVHEQLILGNNLILLKSL